MVRIIYIIILFLFNNYSHQYRYPDTNKCFNVCSEYCDIFSNNIKQDDCNDICDRFYVKMPSIKQERDVCLLDCSNKYPCKNTNIPLSANCKDYSNCKSFFTKVYSSALEEESTNIPLLNSNCMTICNRNRESQSLSRCGDKCNKNCLAKCRISCKYEKSFSYQTCSDKIDNCWFFSSYPLNIPTKGIKYIFTKRRSKLMLK